MTTEARKRPIGASAFTIHGVILGTKSGMTAFGDNYCIVSLEFVNPRLAKSAASVHVEVYSFGGLAGVLTARAVKGAYITTFGVLDTHEGRTINKATEAFIGEHHGIES